MSKQEAKRPEPGLDGKPPESPYSAMAQELVEVYIRQVCLAEHVCLKKALVRLERDIILHVLARIHDNNSFTDAARHSEIMGNKKDRDSLAPDKARHEPENLCLHCHIKSRRRFISN